MHRFFVPKEQIENDSVRIVGSDVNHIKNVLRLKPGDKIAVFDSAQNVYTCEINEFNREFIRGTVVSREKD
ncbi:MAG TPA: RsmE family RNA methyltransferase, partial [Candidatus Omnitrophota bacterium]|nr:RsmE family RNA methyltransferase [Candidatus Omnitrophota bacterium]